MKFRRFTWLFFILAVAGSLALSSCMNQEGVGPGQGELNDAKPSSGGGY